MANPDAFGDERFGWRANWSVDDGKTAPAGRGSESLLVRVIEGEIIPRLLLAHRGPPDASPIDNGGKHAFMGDIESFARLVMTSEPSEIVDRIRYLVDGGIKLERIYVELIAPVARLLGIYWMEDRASFAEVTLGLSRLHRTVHALGRRYRDRAGEPPQGRNVFFAPAPGEQHTLGLTMMEEIFQAAGWKTSSDHSATSASVIRAVGAELVDLVGFSVGCDSLVDPLVHLITQTRKNSRNREIVVVLGGPYFSDRAKTHDLGADRVLFGGDDVVQIAEGLVTEAAGRCGSRTLM